MLLLGLSLLLVACGVGVPPWVRPQSPNPPGYQPPLSLKADHIVNRFDEPRRIRDGRLEIRGDGVHIVAEHPLFLSHSG